MGQRTRWKKLAEQLKSSMPKCTINCIHSNYKPFTWIKAVFLNQVDGDFTEGWEVKYLDIGLDHKGLDQVGDYQEKWVKYKEGTGDNFTIAKPKPLGPRMKQWQKKFRRREPEEG